MTTLMVSDIVAMIDRFLLDEITEAQLIDWADRHECREDIDYEPGFEAEMGTALCWLASPEISGPATPQRVLEIRAELLGSTSD